MNRILDQQYWNQRYEREQTGWDLGQVAPPLKHYIDQLTDKQLSILIPGCGNAYEALYLWERGFEQVTLIDISSLLVQRLRQKLQSTGIQVLQGDFFAHEGAYDLVLEQTFFCALEPALRADYSRKMCDLLRPGGHLSGVLFDRSFEGGPPFGGALAEYKELFSGLWHIKTLASCYNSAKPRMGTEVFINLIKQG